MNELTNKKKYVISEVHRALREGIEPKSQVKCWLERVESLEGKFMESRDEFQRKLKLPGDVPLNVLSSYRLSKHAEEMLDDAHDLKSVEFIKEVSDKQGPERFEEMPSVPTVGMDSVIEQLKNLVADDDVGIIGIYGMGGVGKSALLSRFHNEVLAEANEFDVIIAVELSSYVNVEDIQNKIKARLGLSWKDSSSPKEVAGIIFKSLCKTKFAVIIDNMWQPLNLQAIGIPIPKRQSKCKIILATRNEEVCDHMDAKKKIKLECLSLDESRKLFVEKVGQDLIASNTEIQEQSEIVIKKCGGLPLALIAIARALASKRSVEEWKHFITIMNKMPSQIPGVEEHLLSSLRLSYDSLPNDKLRSCALHFCLYFEGCRVHKSLLHDYWIGEGIIDDFKDMEQSDNKVCYLLGILSAASLIERVDAQGYTKMHPIIRAAIISAVMSESTKKETKWLVQEKEGLTEAPESELWETASTVALGYNYITNLPDAPECPKLLSLKLKNNPSLQKVPDNFFKFMKSLLILDLHSTPITELPSGIGNLLALQFLELGGTKIKSLPKELGALIKLKYLGLNWTDGLRYIPNGVIVNLAELRILRMTVSYKKWKVNPETEVDGVDFEELERLKKLRILDITVGTVEALDRLSESYRVAASTAAILITRCKGLKKIHLPSECFGRHMKSLKWLRISQSNELEELVIGDGLPEDELVLKKIENIVMENLLKAKIIWNSRSLENLQGLFIYGCNGMEQLVYYKVDEDRASSSVTTPFPNLKEIALRGLVDMKRISDDTTLLVFPSLESIELHECPRFKKLNLIAPKLRVIKSQRTLWDQLEWNYENIKASFEQIVRF